MSAPSTKQLMRALTAELRPVTDPSDRRNEASKVVMPNKSQAWVSHHSPWELQAAMTLAWLTAHVEAGTVAA